MTTKTKKPVRNLTCVFHVYRNSKRVKSSGDVVLIKRLRGKVTYPVVNAGIDLLRNQADELVAGQFGKTAYPILHHYDHVVTDEVEECYCFTCKSRFTQNRIYGDILGDELRCPKGHSKVTSNSWGKCHKCKNGKCWEVGFRAVGPDCVMHYYKCDTCGHQDAEPVD